MCHCYWWKSLTLTPSHTCESSDPDHQSWCDGEANCRPMYIVYTCFLTKWPMVYQCPIRTLFVSLNCWSTKLFSQFGVSESLHSDRATNLLSHLMTGVFRLFSNKKLNTTSDHTQCDGDVGMAQLNLEDNKCMQPISVPTRISTYQDPSRPME